MMQKLIQIGNSKGLILSKELLTQFGLNTRETVWVEPDLESGMILIAPKQPNLKNNHTSRLLEILDTVNKEYGPALKKLAGL